MSASADNHFDFICLDGEFANGRRLLELSIFDSLGNELYHQLFKPAGMTRWPSDIHHITPAMVKDMPSFSACRRDIQAIIDRADRVIGFALNNDFEKLTAEGIVGLEKKPVVELRRWFWVCIGQYEGVSIDSGPGLTAVAERLGITVEASTEHSASGDTRVTLECFNRLLDMYIDKFIGREQASQMTVAQIVDSFDAVYEREREPVMRQRAHGYCSLIGVDDGVYKLKCSANDHSDKENCIATIEVNCRFKAEVELKRQLARRELSGRFGHYRLKQADIDKFLAYTNDFDMAESEYYRAVVNPRRRQSSSINIR